MLTHKDFDFDSMRSKTLNELTKEEKEYLSKYVSMKIPNQFYQYVVSYVQTDAYSDSSKKARVHGIYTTFGEAYDGMVEFFNKCWNRSKYKFYIEEDEESESEYGYDAVYEVIVFLKGYGKLCIYKVTIDRELTTFWPETKFVTPEIIKNKGV